MWGDQGKVEALQTPNLQLEIDFAFKMTSSAITRILLANTGFERTDFSTGWGEDFPNHPVFWNFSSDNNKKELVWETGRGGFLKPAEFQPWNQISQTYPFLRFSGLKRSKRGMFEKSCPEVSSNYSIPGGVCSKRRPFIWVCVLWPNGLGVGLGQWVQATIDGLKPGQKTGEIL